jgi:WD repeat-containing protein 48
MNAGQDGASLLITCAGHTVPWDFSLAAVRQWIWRRSDDLVLHFSVRNHGTPLKLPAIRPPS